MIGLRIQGQNMGIGRHCLAGILRYNSARRVSPGVCLRALLLRWMKRFSLSMLESIIINMWRKRFSLSFLKKILDQLYIL
jgi:hypothetical protein